MNRLASIFFEVSARQPYSLFSAIDNSVDGTAFDNGQFVLADLVALGQVGVKIILARENRATVNLGADREPEADRALDCAAIEHGEHARQRDVHRACLS